MSSAGAPASASSELLGRRMMRRTVSSSPFTRSGGMTAMPAAIMREMADTNMEKVIMGTYTVCCSAPTTPAWPVVTSRSRTKAEPEAHSTVSGTDATAGPAPPTTLWASLSASKV